MSIEHIIPESLGNDDLFLTVDVCRKCNNYFGQIESFVLNKTPLAVSRALLGTVTTPEVLSMLGRFLCKIAVELICLKDPDSARSHKFADARKFAREGSTTELWPIFHLRPDHFEPLKRYSMDSDDLVITCDSYSFELIEFMDRFTLFALAVGHDVWAICVNEKVFATGLN